MRQESGPNGALRRNQTSDTDALKKAPDNQFDNQYVCRQIAAQEANLRFYDAVGKKALSPDMRTVIDLSTVMGESQLDVAYWALSTLSAPSERQPAHRRR